MNLKGFFLLSDPESQCYASGNIHRWDQTNQPLLYAFPILLFCAFLFVYGKSSSHVPFVSLSSRPPS